MQIEWLLPTRESRTTNDEIIHHKAKYHCFISYREKKFGAEALVGTSLCNKHKQVLGYYEKIESGQVLAFPQVACKKCFEKWKKEFDIDV